MKGNSAILYNTQRLQQKRGYTLRHVTTHTTQQTVITKRHNNASSKSLQVAPSGGHFVEIYIWAEEIWAGHLYSL